MTKSLRAALACALILVVAAPAVAAEHQLSFDDALAQARERETLLVIDFFTDWCVYCKHFDAALADPESGLQEALDAVVFTSIDAEKGEGIELASRLGVSGFPTYTVLNADGDLVASWAGFGGTEHFMENFTPALADPVPFTAKQERFAANPTAAEARYLASIAGTSGHYEMAMDYLLQAEDLDGDLDASGDLLDTAYRRARKDDSYAMSDYIALARERVLEKGTDPATTLLTTYYVSRATADEADHATVLPFLARSREAIASGEELSPGLVRDVELKTLLWVDKDPDAAVAYKRASMPEGWMEDPSSLNSFAWWCFENRVNLPEAQTLALRGAELAEPGADQAQILDTAAEICNALGNCDEAIELIRLAIEQEPTNAYYGEQLARFEEIQAQTGE